VVVQSVNKNIKRFEVKTLFMSIFFSFIFFIGFLFHLHLLFFFSSFASYLIVKFCKIEAI
jgi:hypothetical protein